MPRPPAGQSAQGLKLRRDHPCATVFLDETGSIAKDWIFAIGLLKVSEPSVLLRALQQWRDRRHWYKEIKYYDVTKGSLGLYKEVVDIAVRDCGASFFCFVADRQAADPVERFGSHWDAYEKLAEQLVMAAVSPSELVTVLADNYSTPNEVLFEQTLRSNVNRRSRRLSVVSVCRLDSKSSDGLQVVDLLTSATALEFRIAAGVASGGTPKAELAQHVRGALGTDSCLGGWRSHDHSVAVYNHGNWQAEALSRSRQP